MVRSDQCTLRASPGRVLLLAVALTVVAALPAKAIPTITCHCFKDRTYDAAQPSAADPYFLASTQNTFFALVFNIDRTSVVLMKQQGVPADDLWIAYWIASRSSGDANSLLEARAKGNSWHDVLKPIPLDPQQVGAHLSKALAAKESAPQMAAGVVDQLLTEYELQNGGELDELRGAGASNQEVILATFLAKRTGQPAPKILASVRSGRQSWGAMLHAAGIDGKNLQQWVADTMKRFRPPATQEDQQ